MAAEITSYECMFEKTSAREWTLVFRVFTGPHELGEWEFVPFSDVLILEKDGSSHLGSMGNVRGGYNRIIVNTAFVTGVNLRFGPLNTTFAGESVDYVAKSGEFARADRDSYVAIKHKTVANGTETEFLYAGGAVPFGDSTDQCKYILQKEVGTTVVLKSGAPVRAFVRR